MGEIALPHFNAMLALSLLLTFYMGTLVAITDIIVGIDPLTPPIPKTLPLTLCGVSLVVNYYIFLYTKRYL